MDYSLYSLYSTEDILKVINNLDSDKAHGYDGISIRMLKICCSSVCRLLKIIYKFFLERGKFHGKWRKANVVPVHKKNDKQLVKIYCPISLLPICGSIFKRLLYNSLLNFLTQNDLISPAHSGFKPSDSYINHLILITREIYHSMDEGYEMWGNFLDISKFNSWLNLKIIPFITLIGNPACKDLSFIVFKHWYKTKGMTRMSYFQKKKKQNGISGNLPNILEVFLRNRKKKLFLMVRPLIGKIFI